MDPTPPRRPLGSLDPSFVSAATIGGRPRANSLQGPWDPSLPVISPEVSRSFRYAFWGSKCIQTQGVWKPRVCKWLQVISYCSWSCWKIFKHTRLNLEETCTLKGKYDHHGFLFISFLTHMTRSLELKVHPFGQIWGRFSANPRIAQHLQVQAVRRYFVISMISVGQIIATSHDLGPQKVAEVSENSIWPDLMVFISCHLFVKKLHAYFQGFSQSLQTLGVGFFSQGPRPLAVDYRIPEMPFISSNPGGI